MTAILPLAASKLTGAIYPKPSVGTQPASRLPRLGPCCRGVAFNRLPPWPTGFLEGATKIETWGTPSDALRQHVAKMATGAPVRFGPADAGFSRLTHATV